MVRTVEPPTSVFAKVSRMSDPAIAVLIGAFNNERTLARAIGSVLDQTVEDLELLVIDDGSEDGTAEVARAAIGVDRRGKVKRLERNVGIADVLNLGLSEVSAPLVAIQDADDFSERGRLRRQLEALASAPEVAVVGARMREVSEEGTELRSRTTFRAGRVEDVLMRFNPIPNGSACFRRDVVLALGGYDPRYRYASEYDLWLRVAEQHGVLTLDEVLVTREMGDRNVASRAERAQIAEALTIRSRAMKRRGSLRGASGLVRPALSYAVPLSFKRRVRCVRGQAP